MWQSPGKLNFLPAVLGLENFIRPIADLKRFVACCCDCLRSSSAFRLLSSSASAIARFLSSIALRYWLIRDVIYQRLHATYFCLCEVWIERNSDLSLPNFLSLSFISLIFSLSTVWYFLLDWCIVKVYSKNLSLPFLFMLHAASAEWLVMETVAYKLKLAGKFVQPFWSKPWQLNFDKQTKKDTNKLLCWSWSQC